MAENEKQSPLSILKGIFAIILMWIANIISIIAMSYICGDFILGSWYNAIYIATLVAIVSTALWSFLTKIFMPFLIYTFGIGALILNDLIFYACSYYIPGVSVGLAAFLQVPLVMALSSIVVSNLLNIDFFNSYIGNTISREAKKRKKQTVKKKYPGLIVLEIDGLAKEILDEAIEKGSMPTLKSWIESNSHSLKEWETDLSSQTGSSQAGILHGNNKDLVAFRWVEKENNNKIMVSSSFSQSPIIEKRISDGNGLLSKNGASRANMFSGDTDNVIFTSSKFKEFKKMYNPSWYAVFSSSFNFQRIFILFIWEMLVEFKSQILHKVRNIQPRLRRGLIYASTRAAANVFLREIITEALIGDIIIGDVDTVYATYVGYDEVAHHSGIRDEDVWNVLKMIDLQFNRLEKAVENSDRPYKFVILSDHGQGNGATFKQRYNKSLPEFVRSLLPEDMKIFSAMDSNLDHFSDSYFGPNESVENIKERIEAIKNYDPMNEHESLQTLKDKYDETIEFLKSREIISNNEQLKNIKKRFDDTLEYIKTYETEESEAKEPKKSELIVLGSGNLALIYFTQYKYRLSYEEMILTYPNLIPGLVNHPGIGFILVNSSINGPLVIGADGIYYLDSDKIEGENPLKNFGENAVKHLKRHAQFKYLPDILVNSFYDPETGEICAFEELIGSHGGLGGSQTKPFILYPSEWKVDGELVGAKSIYDLLKNEIKNLKEL